MWVWVSVIGDRGELGGRCENDDDAELEDDVPDRWASIGAREDVDAAWDEDANEPVWADRCGRAPDGPVREEGDGDDECVELIPPPPPNDAPSK